MLSDFHRSILQRIREKAGVGTLLDVSRHLFVVVVGGLEVARFSTLEGALAHGWVVYRPSHKGIKDPVYVLDRTTGNTFDVKGARPGGPPKGPTEDALKGRGVLG